MTPRETVQDKKRKIAALSAEGLSVDEMADAMNMQPNLVMQYLHMVNKTAREKPKPPAIRLSDAYLLSLAKKLEAGGYVLAPETAGSLRELVELRRVQEVQVGMTEKGANP